MTNKIANHKSYSFALRIIKLYQLLSKEKQEYVISKQILRSGTAIGALIREAECAESKADFIHKLAISNKEANETHYWIMLLRDSNLIDTKLANSFLLDCEELQKLLNSSIKTAKTNLKTIKKDNENQK
ncbi:four helix bundle protein [Arcicella sp. LKC2W]|uniref:four helix bundle protein n=1 Tax=Arcicella sp. LKC2W TaxID=2984198 RepID=UPI002B201885|nr:four helix bundle protein [Arcicella sp. LKC2W]MEA5461159.1 four helix bundle protein [Arcicella sp. LKC2W]